MHIKSNFYIFGSLRQIFVLLASAILLAPMEAPKVLAQAGSGAVVSYEGYGEAQVEQGTEVSAARAQALDRALLDAFQKAVRDLCPPGTSLEEQDKAIQNLAPGMKSFLLRYRIVSEMPTEAAFFLTVEAAFSTRAVREAVARIFSASGQGAKPDSSGSLLLRVNGITSPGLYQEMMSFLRRGVPGVRSVQPLEVFGTSALLRLDSETDAESVAASLRQWEPEGYALRVESNAGGGLALVFSTLPATESPEAASGPEGSP
jgi:hypothetical protein